MNTRMTAVLGLLVIAAAAAGQTTWCTYLGGSGEDRPYYRNGLVVDSEGTTYVVGTTYSVNFPTTAGAFDSTRGGARDGFITRLSADGTNLEWSTLLGGSNRDFVAHLVQLDDQGRILVYGGTNSTDFPVTIDAYDTSHNGGWDAFVAILDPTLDGASQLVYSTYLGGSGEEEATSVVLDPADPSRLVLLGWTQSADFPVTPGAYDTTHNGQWDGFVVRFDLNAVGAGQLVGSTFLGGDGDDAAMNVHVSDSGVVTVSSQTSSSNMPTSSGAFDETFNGGTDYDLDHHVAQLSPDLTTLIYGTYLGGSGDDGGNGMVVEATGEIIIAGGTGSADFPVTLGAYDTTFNGGPFDVFVTRLDPGAEGSAQLVASTYVGGTGYDAVIGLSRDVVTGAVTIVGPAGGGGYPTTPDAIQPAYGGGNWDALLSRLDWSLGELIYSTYIGGGSTDNGFAIVGEVASRITVAGLTQSSDFPVTQGAYDESYNGTMDTFIMHLDLCPADVNEDGVVNVDDLVNVILDWGTDGSANGGDVDGSGTVDVDDLTAVILAWGVCG